MLRAAPVLVLLLGLSGCRDADARALADAEAAFAARAPDAWDKFMAIDAASPEGRASRERLRRADQRYREGIDALALGDDETANTALREAARTAPLDPDLYDDLARSCLAANRPDAAGGYYRKYLLARPHAQDADAVRSALEALEPGVEVLLAPDETEDPGLTTRTVATIAGLASLLLAFVLTLLATRRRRFGLAAYAERHPEMHPTIAYLVGTLRHELLKHRVGVLGALVAALDRGNTTAREVELTVRRVLTGDPLEAAFAEHARAFERALGKELALERDPGFRRAERSIRALARTLRSFDPQRASHAETLREAHAVLSRFDRELSGLASRLTRTRLDRELVEGVVRDLAAEHRAGSVKLDTLEIDVPDEALDLPIFRVDLVVVLRNLVRNAMIAAGEAPAPRAVHVDVRLDLEPTGEEVVRLRIHDSDPTTLTPELLRDRPMDRGLGLVSAAIARYDGALSTEPSDRGLGKAVVVRFFRCMEAA